VLGLPGSHRRKNEVETLAPMAHKRSCGERKNGRFKEGKVNMARMYRLKKIVQDGAKK
jgi:hypothetical protein